MFPNKYSQGLPQTDCRYGDMKRNPATVVDVPFKDCAAHFSSSTAWAKAAGGICIRKPWLLGHWRFQNFRNSHEKTHSNPHIENKQAMCSKCLSGIVVESLCMWSPTLSLRHVLHDKVGSSHGPNGIPLTWLTLFDSMMATISMITIINDGSIFSSIVLHYSEGISLKQLQCQSLLLKKRTLSRWKLLITLCDWSVIWKPALIASFHVIRNLNRIKISAHWVQLQLQHWSWHGSTQHWQQPLSAVRVSLNLSR